MRSYIFILVTNFLLILVSCASNFSNTQYPKRLEEAKWSFYEWNFKMGEIVGINGYVVDTSSSVCFMNELLIDTVNFGDTLEIRICAGFIQGNKKIACACHSPYYIIFGFFPNADTVTYKVERGPIVYRRKELLKEIPDSIYKKLEIYGYHKPKEQLQLFKAFLIQNKDRLNPWLKAEAKKRGYL